MGIDTDRNLRQHIIFTTMILMLAGLFFSRALLSISMFAFVAACILHNDFRAQLRYFSKNGLLIGISILFLIPLLTYFWSDDKETWLRYVRVKLPFIFLPLAFAGNWQLKPAQWKWTGRIFILLVLAGCCWSIWQYAPEMEDINRSYLRAKVIPTPFENDHVRFSLTVTIAILCAAFLFGLSSIREEKILMGVVIVLFIAFLHLLSARTGLLALYMLLFLGAIYLLFHLKNTKLVLAVVLASLLMPMLAWFALPTFQNRIRYFIYDLGYIQQDTYLPGANDGNRIISMKAGWGVMNEHVLGAGFGDIHTEVNSWYNQNIHGMLETDRILPSSEWMMHGAGAGWAGFLLFTLVMVLPFFQRFRSGRYFWTGLNGVLAFSFIFDIGLEVQFGVFLYAFLVLWWWKWLRSVT